MKSVNYHNLAFDGDMISHTKMLFNPQERLEFLCTDCLDVKDHNEDWTAYFQHTIPEAKFLVASILYDETIVTFLQDFFDNDLVGEIIWEFLDCGKFNLDQSAHLAVVSGNTPMVELLVKIPKTIPKFRDLILYACCDGRSKIVQMLLQNGAQPDAFDSDDGYNCLTIAANWGYISTLEVLLAHGADVNSQTESGNSAIISVVQSEVLNRWQKRSVLEFLISNGADIALRHGNGKMAVDFCEDKMLCKLLEPKNETKKRKKSRKKKD